MIKRNARPFGRASFFSESASRLDSGFRLVLDLRERRLVELVLRLQLDRRRLRDEVAGAAPFVRRVGARDLHEVVEVLGVPRVRHDAVTGAGTDARRERTGLEDLR